MRLLIGLVMLGGPAVALAQGEPPQPPPPPPYSPAPAPDGTPAPGPGTQPAQPDPFAQPAGAAPYAPPQPGQVYQEPPPPPLRNGMTFEANLGIGWLHISDDNNTDTSDLAIGGLSLGVGGWVSPQIAITGRVAGVTYSENGGQLSNIFLGPAIQYWVDDHFWAGGGAGLAVLAASNDSGNSDSINGFGLDLRVGYTFTAGSENTFNVSFELNPGFYSENNSSATITGIGILLGYQHL